MVEATTSEASVADPVASNLESLLTLNDQDLKDKYTLFDEDELPSGGRKNRNTSPSRKKRTHSDKSKRAEESISRNYEQSTSALTQADKALMNIKERRQKKHAKTLKGGEDDEEGKASSPRSDKGAAGDSSDDDSSNDGNARGKDASSDSSGDEKHRTSPRVTQKKQPTTSYDDTQGLSVHTLRKVVLNGAHVEHFLEHPRFDELFRLYPVLRYDSKARMLKVWQIEGRDAKESAAGPHAKAKIRVSCGHNKNETISTSALIQRVDKLEEELATLKGNVYQAEWETQKTPSTDPRAFSLFVWGCILREYVGGGQHKFGKKKIVSELQNLARAKAEQCWTTQDIDIKRARHQAAQRDFIKKRTDQKRGYTGIPLVKKSSVALAMESNKRRGGTTAGSAGPKGGPNASVTGHRAPSVPYKRSEAHSGDLLIDKKKLVTGPQIHADNECNENAVAFAAFTSARCLDIESELRTEHVRSLDAALKIAELLTR